LKPYYAAFANPQPQGYLYYHNGFDTHYNSLQISFDKRFSQGLQLTANYNYQKAYDYHGEDFLKKYDWGRYDDLRDNQLTVFGNYELPFGKGRRFASDLPAALNYVVGGWELSPSVSWASGLPFTASYGECSSDVPAGPCRPNRGSGSFPLKLTSFDPISRSRTYFIPPGLGGAFTRPALDTFGTSPQNAFTGPSFFNTDLSLLKTIPIRERISVQFRMDAFNVFNVINPGNPGNTCIDCTVANGAGVIHGMALGASPRQLEFALKVLF
jgi:hypothetical protein